MGVFVQQQQVTCLAFVFFVFLVCVFLDYIGVYACWNMSVKVCDMDFLINDKHHIFYKKVMKNSVIRQYIK